ncbi:hypothetical protein A3750_21530 [Oleiphilus sp. HI0079]|nr:hypothetical protein A3750_21530 [Oleiphilus sp. HI0079]
MYDYIVYELPELLTGQLGMQGNAAIMGHSMGGHGALTIGLRHPDLYRSISAFSPICHPVESPWGQKAFSGYLGDDTEAWAEHDATLLLERVESHLPILVDQGSEDQFLKEQLGTTQLQAALKRNKGYSQVNMRETYDHSYFFIASFIEEHLRFHAEHLK